MSDKNFDRHIKSILENVEPAYEPATWALLEKRLDAAFSEEQPAPVASVDKAVYHMLERLEAPYQPAHWTMLAARLNLQKSRLRRLRVAKVAELALLLLLIWNASAYWNKQSVIPTLPTCPQPDVPIAQTNPGQAGRAFKAGNPSGNTPAPYNFSLGNPDAPILLSNAYTTAASLPSVLQSLSALAQQAARPAVAVADLLPRDGIQKLNTTRIMPDLTTVAVVVDPYREKSAQSPFYVTAAGGLQRNRVLINGQRRSHGGHSAQVAVGYRAGAWGLEIGAGYAYRQFTPKKEVEIYSGNISDGYFGSTMTGVDAGMLTVPVKVTRRVGRIGKTTALAVAGITTNIALYKNYDYGTVYYSPDALPPNFLPDPNQSPKLRQTGRGALDVNGRLKGNIYASVDAGIRLERPINQRYTAFIEPGFQAAFTGKGFGPRQEPVNTLSIQAGVMAFL